MPQCYSQEFDSDGLQFSHVDYNEASHYYESSTHGAQKLSVSRTPTMWQRLALAIFSLALWAIIMLCFKLAWDWTWYL